MPARNSDFEDSRYLDRDYSIGGGVTMSNQDIGHGFLPHHDMNDRVRGTMGTRRGEHYGKGPKGWKRSDDKIREDVCEALYQDPYVDATEIEVAVENGTVLLKGWIDSRESKREAEICAEEISGVHDVRNELFIRNRKLA